MKYKTRSLLLLLALAAPTVGCVHQRAVAIEDHPKMKVTRLETVKTYKFWAFQFLPSYQYWICADKGQSLNCKLQCDSGDLKCPKLKRM